MIELNKIYNESCLDTLARMPDNFLDCVVTSPPYYGLRSYNTKPQVWGGNGKCSHDWNEFQRKGITGGTASPKVQIKGSENFQIVNDTTQAFCRCGAWRGELGLEPTFQLYIQHLTDIFREVHRVLKPTGTMWVNLGDSYSGSGKGIGSKDGSHGKSVFTDDHIQKTDWTQISVKPKSLMNIPHRFAIAMTDELGFIQRNQINWFKRACMPSSAKDRFTVDFEPIFFFSKNEKYYFEQQFEPQVDWGTRDRSNGKYFGEGLHSDKGLTGNLNPNGRNMRTTWDVAYEPSSEEHFASYPTRLVEIPIRAGSPEGGIIYDPFGGTATTALVAHKLGRNWICSELQPKYADIAEKRLEPYLAQTSLF